MKPITQNFQNALKGIKQIDTIISYADKENTNFIITQNSDFLLTENSEFLVTQSGETVIDNNGIQNIGIYWNTNLLKSCCKLLDIETSNPIPKGTELNVKIGLLVDGDYEYVDYGKFYTTEESTKNLDTGTYLTTAYDKMIKFNILINENPLALEEGTTYTLEQYLKMICNKCEVPYDFDFTNIINNDKAVISGDPYVNDKTRTYRDALDDIAECLGTNFIINADNKITNKELLLTSLMTIDGDNLRDTNVRIGEKKPAIDGLQVYDGSAMINYVGDDTSIFKIKNNNIMSANSNELLSGVLTVVRDFTYYEYSLDTFGILALEPFDCFTLSYNNTNYLLCSLHNQISTTSGLGETIDYEFDKEDGIENYVVPSSEDKLRDASIEIDKANSQIVLKANSEGNLVQVQLNADASEGSEFNVKADNINFEGKTFNLTADNMAITSTNFSVDKDGNITANSGTFGGSINTAEDCIVGNNLYVGQNQTGFSSKTLSFSNNAFIQRYVIDGDEIVNLHGNWVCGISSSTDYVSAGYNAVNISRQPTIGSDKRLKKNIKDVDVSWIDKLKVREYEYKSDDGNKQIGLIAQDYIGEDYGKYFLSKNKDGYYGIQYGSINNALIQYCQELKQEINELKQEIKSLKGDDN